MTRIFPVALALVALAGCCLGGTPPETMAAPPTPAPVAPTPAPLATFRRTFFGSTIETTDGPYASISVVGTEVVVTAPAGTLASFAGQTQTVAPSPEGPTHAGTVAFPLDVLASIAGLGVHVREGSGSTLPELRTHAPVVHPIALTRPGTARIEGEFTIDDRDLLRLFAEHFAGARTGPVAVPREGTRSAALVVHIDAFPIITGVTGEILGPGDVATVALVENITREGPCGRYVRADGATSDVHWYATDARVSVRERLTGNVLAERTFSASRPRCSAILRDSESPHTYFRDADVAAFVSRSIPSAPPPMPWPPAAVSCQDSAECVELSLSPEFGLTEASAREWCSSTPATMVLSRCPSGSVGSCEHAGYTTFYYPSEIDAASAQSVCEALRAVWHPAP